MLTLRMLVVLMLLVPALSRAQTPNLHPQPDLATAQGWALNGATHSGGTLELRQHTTALGPAIPITPGKTYTCGVYFQGTHAPTDFMRLSLNLAGATGQSLRNSPSATDYAYAQPGVWQEAAIFHTARADERSMRLLLSRAIALDGRTPVQIDRVYCREGMALDQPPSPKRPFHGGLVQVNAEGKVFIRQSDGTRKQEFLRCMFAIGTEDWRSYAPNGWNCNMWISTLAGLERSVKAGMPYAFFQLAQYIHKGGWAYGKLDQLRKDLGAILASPYADNLIGYYYDNESPDQIAMAQQVLAVVAELDTKDGQRQRPIYILDGNPGRHLAYTGMADITGTYAFGGGNTHLHLLQRLPGQTTPVVFGQIQQERGKTATSMRAQVLAVLSDGGAAIGYWHTNPIAKELWYKDFPAIVAAALHCTPAPPCAAGPQEAQTPRPTPPPVSTPPAAPPVSTPPALGARATYYVAKTGSDSNPGTSASPFLTIIKGASRLGPGDMLIVRAGTYTERLHNVIPGGTSWSPSGKVTVRAEVAGTVTILPPAGGGDKFNLFFHGTSTRYIEIDGFVLDGNGPGDALYGVLITLGAHHIRIQHTEIKNTMESGGLVSTGAPRPAEGSTISCCNEFRHLHIHHTARSAYVGQSAGGDGIYIATSKNLIEHSWFHDNPGYGIHVYNSYGGANDNIVRGNRVEKSNSIKNAAAIALSSGQRNKAYNNVVFNNGGGILLNSGQAEAYNNTLVNNTVSPHTDSDIAFIVQVGGGGVQVRNNIIFGHPVNFAGNACGGARSATGCGGISTSNNVTTNPQFVNLAGKDFRLTSSSPARNAGMRIPLVPDDILGVVRPQEGQYDVGAYEFHDGPQVPQPPPVAALPAPKDFRILSDP